MFGPALNTSDEAPPNAELPTLIPHRPLIAMGRPLGVRSGPMNLPVTGLKALIQPLPRLPTSRSPANGPNPLGAIARPQGSFSGPWDTRCRMSWPLTV